LVSEIKSKMVIHIAMNHVIVYLLERIHEWVAIF